MTDYTESDPDKIRADIERTRGNLGSDVDALADKVTPSKVVEREKAKIKSQFGGVKDRIFGAADDAKGSASSHLNEAGESVSGAAHTAVAKAQGAPLAVGLIAFGVGALVASLLPTSSKEKELASQVKEAAQPLVSEVTDAAKDVADNLRGPAMDAADAVRSQAVDSADAVKTEATGAVGEVKDSAAEAKHAVQSDVS
jgi:ElaB/YqjD/DUF883 family membrane-anchored ribosome-binding protein